MNQLSLGHRLIAPQAVCSLSLWKSTCMKHCPGQVGLQKQATIPDQQFPFLCYGFFEVEVKKKSRSSLSLKQKCMFLLNTASKSISKDHKACSD